MPDWIPSRKADYSSFVANMTNVISAVPATWNLLAADVTALTNGFNAWLSAYNTRLASEAQLAADVLNENTLQDALDVILRDTNAKVQAPPPVSDANKELAGFPVRDTNPTPVGVPTTAPFVNKVEVRAAGELIVHFRDQSTPNSRAKPPGVREAEIWAKVDGPAPVDGTGCVYLGSDSATPYNAVFDVAQAGKNAWLCLRWKNTRGQTGPWGPVFATMVPGTGGGE